MNNWKIEFVKADATILDNGDTMGLCVRNKRIIYIGTRGLQQNMETLRHELTHALRFELLSGSLDTTQPEINEEYLCDFVANYGQYIVELSNKVYSEYGIAMNSDTTYLLSPHGLSVDGDDDEPVDESDELKNEDTTQVVD